MHCRLFFYCLEFGTVLSSWWLLSMIIHPQISSFKLLDSNISLHEYFLLLCLIFSDIFDLVLIIIVFYWSILFVDLLLFIHLVDLSIYLISKRYMTIADINIDHMLLMLLSYYCMLFSITLAWCYQWHHFDGFRSREFDVRALNKVVISSMYAFLGLHEVSDNIFSQRTLSWIL